MTDFKTIKEYEDEIERLRNGAYLLMLEKFPVGSWVEYYQGSMLMRVKVFQHAKNKCSLRVNDGERGSWLYWVPAVMCEPENPVEVRTIKTGSNACKIRNEREKGRRFGEGCRYFVSRRDSNGEITIVFCNNRRNPEDTEGNCREEICPLGKKEEKDA